MSDWRPEKEWVSQRSKYFERNQPKTPYRETRQVDYEAGANAMYKAVMEQRPSNEEIRLKIISCLYGGSDVPELLEWLKEKLLVK